MGTLRSMAITFVMEHKSSAWTIGWDMNLLTAAYAVSSLLFLLRYSGVKVGPDSSGLSECQFVPRLLIVIGLYSVLWDKYKEKEAREEIPELVKLGITGNNQPMMIEDIEANNIEIQRHETMKLLPFPAITISAAMLQPPMIAMEALKP
ncbi:WAT1-related At5g07050-like [Olea europaea subsp. europaea]|uniref:WAT1-related At5g07050-like n=1 Tax=Olea europaea subsp. europaea TaxID=158383 RepID=A0A8S0S3X4_OLEEU|nr:WAT1-related At5g07050-like [Olea europaea subsp. europaea]